MDISHYGVKLETQSKKDNEIMYLEEKEYDLSTYTYIRKLYEVNIGEYQLINACSKAGWMSPTVSENIIAKYVKSLQSQ